ncbi:hypothetical protein K440DRAFT_657564 [Wilcoxina mikolae CBS 423.85]|nr:hypothetical protein K440DRAFT_657564 [Wilcoxina mikolae CBS 423.85]
MSPEEDLLSDDEIAQVWKNLRQDISTWISTYLSGAAIADPTTAIPYILDDYIGGYGYIWMNYDHPLSFVIEKVLWSYLDASVFSKYLFGMSDEWNKRLHALEATLAQDEPLLVIAKWRVETIEILHRNQRLGRACAADLVHLVDSFEQLIVPFTKHLQPGIEEDNARKALLLEIFSTAVNLHYALRIQLPVYELSFLGLFTHGSCDKFDPTIMEDASAEYPQRVVSENIAEAYLFEELFRDARNKAVERQNERIRKERKEALEGEEKARKVEEIPLERGREERVSFFVTPALRKMEVDGTVKVLGKAKVFTAI